MKNKLLLISKLLKIAGTALIVSCFLIPLGNAISLISGSLTKKYGSLYSFIFGGQIHTENISYKAYGISVLGLLSFILLFISLAAIIASFLFSKKDTVRSVLVLSSSITCLIESIMFACLHKSLALVLSDSILNGHSDSVANTIFNNSKLLFGVWGISLFGFFAAFALLASLLFDGTFDKVRSKIRL